MISWVFDVDGVLCNTGEEIDSEFENWFVNWAKDKQVYLLTGSQREKTILQIKQRIVDLAMVSYNCIGNSIWTNGEEERVNQFDLTAEEIAWFEAVLDTSEFPIRAGRHIDVRPGAINFSVLGRNGDLKQRAEYKKFDQNHHERERIKSAFTARFPRFEVFLGGDVSIDICLKNANKGQVINKIPGPRYFFGDRCYPGGIDEPFARKCKDPGDRVFEVMGYQQTWNILKILEENKHVINERTL